MRPRFGLGEVCVGGGEQTRRRRQASGGRAPVVPGPVGTLVVKGGDRCEGAKKGGTGENPLGVVGVQPHPLPVVGCQRVGLVPDAEGDRDAPEVVDERRSPDPHDLAGVEPAPRRGRGRPPRHPRGMADQIARGEVGEVAHRLERRVDRLPLEEQPRRRLRRQHLIPHRLVSIGREDLRVPAGETRGDRGVERAAGTLAHHAHRVLVAAQHALEGRVASDVKDPHRHWDRIPPYPRGSLLPSQRAAKCANNALMEAGSRGDRSICATWHEAATWFLNALAALGSPRASRTARTGAGVPGGAIARMIPAIISGRDPNLAGVAYVVSACSSPKISAAVSAPAVQPT